MPAVPPSQKTPYVEIIEQPSSKSTRFRYECEGRFAGSILGKTATNEQKTFPAIKVHNHNGACVVVVSLVTADDDPKPKPHPHTLVGPECRQGVCTKKVKQNLENIQFPNLGIQCKKKAELKDALTLRQQIRVDPFRTGFDHMEKPQLNNINLMMVKLCFQVFLPDESGKYQKAVPPVCSEPIVDKKSAGELAIHSFLPETCVSTGKEEMVLLTGKLPKADEFEVRFYEGLPDKPLWEAFGSFTQKDIHQSVAVTLKIPEYTRPMNRHKQQVMFELRKRNNHEEKSASRKFFYISPESKSKYSRPNKRENDDQMYGQDKRFKSEMGHGNGAGVDDSHTPAVLDHISIDTNSSVGSAFGSNSYRQDMYNPQQQQMSQQQMSQQQAPMYQSFQQPYQPQLQSTPQYHQQHVQHQQGAQRHPNSMPPQMSFQTMRDGKGQEVLKMNVADWNITKNDETGQVFMTPGVSNYSGLLKPIELVEDAFIGHEMTIDEILQAAKNNPNSEIYVPSNLSEHINTLFNNVLEGEPMQPGVDGGEMQVSSSINSSQAG